ncbi:PREDICTED: uncharacterized protein LOC109463525 [Branchiostoma belcheri]|uniref:Uncharacterized protein LOC109463525 n=1 Tax=Branchiostoma belcheri TaxID=7741 RepID=A0A6P4YAU3_BRABE|nr:PREDICTED: uncharacterized protein LOC109463525 [Branchiostoma belcheri]
MFRLKVHAGRAQDMLTGGAFVLLLGAMLLVIYLWTASIPVRKYASDTFDHYNFDDDVLKDAYADLVGNLDAEGGGDGVIDQGQGCRLAPVGVDDTLQKIPAEQLTASSANQEAEASRGRLNYKAVSGGEGAWVPERQDREQWIQVDLGRDLVVGGVVTQGSDDEANPGFVTSYKLSYSLTGDYWITYSNVTAPEMLFSGNSNGRDPDVFTVKQLKSGAVILHVVCSVYMFLGTAIVCEDYFMPSLLIIANYLHLKPSVTGATLIALGMSMPELVSSAVGVFVSKNDIGVGVMAGTAVANYTLIIGCCCLMMRKDQQVHLKPWPLTRDTVWYIFSLGVLIIIIFNGKIDW